MKKINGYVMAVAMLMLSAGCGAVGSETAANSSVSGSGDPAEYSGSSLEGGAVTKVNINTSTDTAEIDFGNLSGSEEYVLAVYSYDPSGDGQSLAVEGANADVSPVMKGAVKKTDEDLNESFDAQLRRSEQDLDVSSPVQRPKALVKAATLPVGSTKDFKVLNTISGSSGYETVTAELRYANDYVYYYVDVRDANRMSDDDIETIAEDYFSPELIENERALFGNNSDVDGDGHISVLFTEVVNQMGGSSGGIITGFFYAVDLLSSDKYSQSNEGEVIYTYVPDAAGDLGTAISRNFSMSNIYPSVLPHEYKHMINYNQHVFLNNGSAESAWLNEALSHLAEGMSSMNEDSYMEGVGNENASRVSGYLADISDISFADGASLYQRGGSFLWARYFYEQAEKGLLAGASSGAEFIDKLMNTSKTGVDNFLAAAIGNNAGDDDFLNLLGQFGVAMFMDGSGLTDDPRLELDGMDLRGSQHDNRGTVLQGPAVTKVDSFPLSSSVGASSIAYIQISADQIIDAGGTITLDVGNGNQVGAYLIQTGL